MPFRPLQKQLGFRAFALGDVERRTQHPGRSPVRIRIPPAPRRDPPLSAVRQNDTKFSRVIVPIRHRASHLVLYCLALVVAADGGDHGAHLVECQRILFEEKFQSLGVGQNSTEWLV